MFYSYLPNKIIAETDNEFGVNLDKFIIQKKYLLDWMEEFCHSIPTMLNLESWCVVWLKENQPDR